MLLSGPLMPLLRWPEASRWRQCVPIALTGFALVTVAAASTGLVYWNPLPWSVSLLAAALMLLVVPALGEELLFRWLLFPGASLPGRRVLVILSIAAFVVWHPVQAWLGFGPAWSGLFLEPRFLLVVAVTGIALAALRDASESLWPPIAFHWAIICAWKFLGGGPF